MIMAPTKEKPKHVYQPPSWIDGKFVRTLSKDKQKYWATRIQGGAPKPKATSPIKIPEDIVIGFDNSGRMVAKTRALRRQKLPTENKYTKSTHSIKKARKNK